VGHVARDVVDLLFLVAIEHALAHHLAYGRVGRLAGRDRAHGDVAVGDETDEPVFVADRHRAAVAFHHDAGDLADALVRIGELDVGAHDFADLHRVLHAVQGSRLRTPRNRISVRARYRRRPMFRRGGTRTCD